MAGVAVVPAVGLMSLVVIVTLGPTAGYLDCKWDVFLNHHGLVQ